MLNSRRRWLGSHLQASSHHRHPIQRITSVRPLFTFFHFIHMKYTDTHSQHSPSSHSHTIAYVEFVSVCSAGTDSTQKNIKQKSSFLFLSTLRYVSFLSFGCCFFAVATIPTPRPTRQTPFQFVPRHVPPRHATHNCASTDTTLPTAGCLRLFSIYRLGGVWLWLCVSARVCVCV